MLAFSFGSNGGLFLKGATGVAKESFVPPTRVAEGFFLFTERMTSQWSLVAPLISLAIDVTIESSVSFNFDSKGGLLLEGATGVGIGSSVPPTRVAKGS